MAQTKLAKKVGEIILEQMGGYNRLAMMLGINKMTYTKNGVAFGWPNRQRSKGNYVEITLDPDDTYTIEFFNLSIRGKKPVKKHRNVYAEDLVGIFEGQTGWYLRLGSLDQRAQPVRSDPEILSVEARLAQVAKTGAATGVTKLQPNMPRPGPFLEIGGKPGFWKVMRFQPHQSEPEIGARTIGEIAWGAVQKVTKAGKPTGKSFNVRFFDKGNKLSVNWKGRSYLSSTYKEHRDLKLTKAQAREKAKMLRPIILNDVLKVKGVHITKLTATDKLAKAVENEIFKALNAGKEPDPKAIAKAVDKHIKKKAANMNDTNLRGQLIRLAHANPEMRPHILPLITAAGPNEVTQIRDMEKLTGPLTLTDEGEENVYFTDGDGERHFYKTDEFSSNEQKKLRRYITAGKKGEIPEAFKKNIEKMKAKSKGKKDDDGDDKGKDKFPDFLKDKGKKDKGKKDDDKGKGNKPKKGEVPEAFKKHMKKKKGGLRSELIRLAHARPELRDELLPLIK